MREIKFRAWDKDEKFMVFQMAGLSEYIDVFKFNEWLNSSVYVLMQYVGLKDKNGKEIYEGDIVKWEQEFEETKVSTIEYIGHGFWVKDESFGWEGEKLWDWREIEIIGNIYENPELLEAK